MRPGLIPKDKLREEIADLRGRLDLAWATAKKLEKEANSLRPYKRGSMVLMAGLIVLLIVAIAGWAR